MCTPARHFMQNIWVNSSTYLQKRHVIIVVSPRFLSIKESNITYTVCPKKSLEKLSFGTYPRTFIPRAELGLKYPVISVHRMKSSRSKLPIPLVMVCVTKNDDASLIYTKLQSFLHLVELLRNGHLQRVTSTPLFS